MLLSVLVVCISILYIVASVLIPCKSNVDVVTIIKSKNVDVPPVALFISNPLNIEPYELAFHSKKESLENDRYILFAPMQSKTTYLINKNGTAIHTWSSDYIPGVSVYMLNDGSILRTIRLALFGGGSGGGIQRITWDGTIIWDYRYYTDDYLSHHDIEILPNGNILMIAWEFKTRDDAITAGRDPYKLMGNTIAPDHIIEVKPTGPTTGEIVWEWHAWDHLIQDYDPTKDNYGIVEEHPELLDINFGSIGWDWLHINSVDYNKELDQILLSVKHFDEIWIIDHSTTIQEASGHTGGNSGKGGDILYRWGNPIAYRAGTADDQKFRRQHDAQWIEYGCPGEGNILVFNNLGGFPDGWYSTVDEIVPPIDDNGTYYLEPGSSYKPKEQNWIYKADFYDVLLCGAQRIKNGNTFITRGSEGYLYEINPEKEIVWMYKNPYPENLPKSIFKFQTYQINESSPEKPDLDCKGSFNWIDVKGGEILTGFFQVQNIGGSDSFLNWSIVSFPDWGNWTFNPENGENLTVEDGPITVHVSVVAPNKVNTKFEGYIIVENQEDSEDYDVIPIFLKTSRKKEIQTSLFLNLFQNPRKRFPILNFISQ